MILSRVVTLEAARPLSLGRGISRARANTRGLWIAEGITNYYGHLMQRRAGLWDDKKFWQR